MLSKLKSLFLEIAEGNPEDIENFDPKQLAAAALMIEIATADDHFDATEIQTLASELQRQFSMDSITLHRLIDHARSRSDEATSLYEFTRCVNDEFDPKEKFDLLTGMWRIAFADMNLDKYEEHLVRRVADLIYVSQTDFIKAKQAARDVD